MKRELEPEAIAQGIESMAEQILRDKEEENLILVGIRSRGDEVAERLGAELERQGRRVELGMLDISLYRDDYEHLVENPQLQGSKIEFEVEGAQVILVDDVLFTGRTIRAAMDALCDYGRPGRIDLAVLIDRGHRELPITPQYVGISLETGRQDHVLVYLQKTDDKEKIVIQSP